MRLVKNVDVNFDVKLWLKMRSNDLKCGQMTAF